MHYAVGVRITNNNKTNGRVKKWWSSNIDEARQFIEKDKISLAEDLKPQWYTPSIQGEVESKTAEFEYTIYKCEPVEKTEKTTVKKF